MLEEDRRSECLHRLVGRISGGDAAGGAMEALEVALGGADNGNGVDTFIERPLKRAVKARCISIGG